MEFCILFFDGSDSAENALKTAIDGQADRNPWIFDIGTVARPLNGRMRMSAARPIGRSKTFREGDRVNAAEASAYAGYFVSLLAGPLSAMLLTSGAGLDVGSAARQRERPLTSLDELKQKLSRSSSALVLIASPETGDQFVGMFGSCESRPTVVRHDLTDELQDRLEALDRAATQELVNALMEGCLRTPESQGDLSSSELSGRSGGEALQGETDRYGSFSI